MTADSFRLFPFQEEAAQEMRDAALAWVAYAASHGPPRYGATDIPFLGQLKAVTGSGKTPVLAQTVAGIGNGVVLWTTRSSAVVEQTYANLNGKYRSLLPAKVSILRDIPSQIVWRELIESTKGLTIWVLTVASWNEAEADSNGSGEARLRLRRDQPDWAGEGSPWNSCVTSSRGRFGSSPTRATTKVKSNSTSSRRYVPKGSSWPLPRRWSTSYSASGPTRSIKTRRPANCSKKAHVPIRTRDVVDANLLKTTIELIDYRSGAEESLDGALAALKRVEDAADSEGVSVTPRAIHVVERSNPTRGSHDEARPVAIWRHLRMRGVPAEDIAIFTDTKELPEDAERITSLSQLEPRYRHIIFNQTLQEGWDDPEAYVCYFDGVTKSFVRIRQIVGRVLRQPSARRFAGEPLNTATLILQTPAAAYETVVTELRAELRLYAPDDEPAFSTLRLKTRKEPLEPVPVKRNAKKLSLPRRALKAPAMTKVDKDLKSTASRPWAQEDLDAPGTGRKATVSLKEGSEEYEYLDVLRSARTQNGTFLRRRLQQRNRACVNAIHPDRFRGSAFEQFSCHGSQAQIDLTNLAASIIDYFEDRVGYQGDPDPDRATWKIGEYRPRGKEMIPFDRAAHTEYSKADFNTDELAFARAVDRVRGIIWHRNPPNDSQGFGIPLPKKVGDSSTFYPDFLMWKKDLCWAVDTTGRHLLDEKVRGKLVALETPRMALVVRGTVDLGSGSREGKEGWSLVVGRPNLKPIVEHSDDLDALVSTLLSE